MSPVVLWRESEDAVGHLQALATHYALEPQVFHAVVVVVHLSVELFDLGHIEGRETDVVLELKPLQIRRSVR